MKESKTQQALKLMRENPGMSQYRACKTVGLNQSVLSRAVNAEREKAKRASHETV